MITYHFLYYFFSITIDMSDEVVSDRFLSNSRSVPQSVYHAHSLVSKIMLLDRFLHWVVSMGNGKSRQSRLLKWQHKAATTSKCVHFPYVWGPNSILNTASCQQCYSHRPLFFSSNSWKKIRSFVNYTYTKPGPIILDNKNWSALEVFFFFFN